MPTLEKSLFGIFYICNVTELKLTKQKKITILMNSDYIKLSSKGLLVWTRWHRLFSLCLPAKHSFINPGNDIKISKGIPKGAEKKASWFGNLEPEEQHKSRSFCIFGQQRGTN